MSEETLKPNEYRCDHCGGVYEKIWSDEEAMAESKENFGDIPADDLAIICDDCYNKFMGIQPKEVSES